MRRSGLRFGLVFLPKATSCRSVHLIRFRCGGLSGPASKLSPFFSLGVLSKSGCHPWLIMRVAIMPCGGRTALGCHPLQQSELGLSVTGCKALLGVGKGSVRRSRRGAWIRRRHGFLPSTSPPCFLPGPSSWGRQPGGVVTLCAGHGSAGWLSAARHQPYSHAVRLMFLRGGNRVLRASAWAGPWCWCGAGGRAGYGAKDSGRVEIGCVGLVVVVWYGWRGRGEGHFS